VGGGQGGDGEGYETVWGSDVGKARRSIWGGFQRLGGVLELIGLEVSDMSNTQLRYMGRSREASAMAGAVFAFHCAVHTHVE
jgi:hypothetical protein